MRLLIAGAVLAFATQTAVAGPYAPAAGQVGSTAIRYDDARFVAWGSVTGEVVRGPIKIDALPEEEEYGETASFGNAMSAPIGQANAIDLSSLSNPNNVVSLGDGGSLTLLFANPIFNGPSWDFAVFENGFQDTFLELAFVEVTSDGASWTRFPCHSATQITTQIDQNSENNALDPTNIDGLAGKYRAGFGTPFDLSQLTGTPGLDLNHIIAIRVVDVVGSINPAYATRDSDNRIINDPFTTAFAQGGFDLDAIGVIHSVPEPGAALGLLVGGFCLGLGRIRRVR